MKVLHICRNLAGSTVFPQLFESLRDLGIEQTVFVPEVTEANRGKNVPDGIPTEYAVTLRQTDTLFFWRKAHRTLPILLSTMNLSGTDLVHAHTLFTDGSIALALKEARGLPFAVTLRYSDVAVIWKYEPHLRPMARRILRAASQVAVLSPTVRDQVLTFLPAGERQSFAEKLHVIPNGLDPRWLGTAPRTVSPGDPVTVGFAGVMNRRKRPLDALKAVHLADRNSGRFAFLGCGTGPLESSLQAALGPRDRLVGRLSGMEAMKSFYAECNMLLVPSSAETFGMVYLEAMSQGVPVLYTRGQGFDGQFPEGEVGYAVRTGDIKGQADALLQLLEDYPARSARCVSHAEAFVWPKVAVRWQDLYNQVLQQNPS